MQTDSNDKNATPRMPTYSFRSIEHESDLGHVLIERVVTWGTPPGNFPRFVGKAKTSYQHFAGANATRDEMIPIEASTLEEAWQRFIPTMEAELPKRVESLKQHVNKEVASAMERASRQILVPGQTKKPGIVH